MGTTASTVRSFYRSNEKAFQRLSDAAKVTVEEGARGRLHPEVVTDYNKRRKATLRYETGATSAAATEAKSQAQALREAAAEAGFTVGKRGPLPKGFLDSLKG